MVHLHMCCNVVIGLNSNHHLTINQIYRCRNGKQKKIIKNLLFVRKGEYTEEVYTYSPAPIDKLSGFPLIKYKFSPVQ